MLLSIAAFLNGAITYFVTQLAEKRNAILANCFICKKQEFACFLPMLRGWLSYISTNR
jgi:hypothetical protein